MTDGVVSARAKLITVSVPKEILASGVGFAAPLPTF